MCFGEHRFRFDRSGAGLAFFNAVEPFAQLSSALCHKPREFSGAAMWIRSSVIVRFCGVRKHGTQFSLAKFEPGALRYPELHDEGRIVGKGTHYELMETCEVYKDIALSQLSVEELA